MPRPFEALVRNDLAQGGTAQGGTAIAPSCSASLFMKHPIQAALSLVLLAWTSGCLTSRPYVEPTIPTTGPARICTEAKSASCRDALQIEKLLAPIDLEVVDATGTPSGNQGAYLLTLRARDVVFRAKWRERKSPSTFVGSFSMPERGVIAYQTQKLFLPPGEIVAPPTSGYCIPTDDYRRVIDEDAERSFDDVDCVFGYLSYWIPDVRTLKSLRGEEGPFGDGTLYSASRFAEHGLYAEELARLNVFAFVVDHDDAHDAQFPISFDPFQIWSVDHSMAFTSIESPINWFEEDWSEIRVPAIPSDLARRLTEVRKNHVERLRRIEDYERIGDRLVPAEPADIEPSSRRAWGASKNERELIWQRISELQDLLTAGALRRF